MLLYLNINSGIDKLYIYIYIYIKQKYVPSWCKYLNLNVIKYIELY